MSDYIRTCTDENHAHECPVIRKSNETIIAERDALKVECAHREMEEHRLSDELERVKAYIYDGEKSEKFKTMETELNALKAELERAKAITPMESNLACRIVLLEEKYDALVMSTNQNHPGTEEDV